MPHDEEGLDFDSWQEEAGDTFDPSQELPIGPELLGGYFFYEDYKVAEERKAFQMRHAKFVANLNKAQRLHQEIWNKGGDRCEVNLRNLEHDIWEAISLNAELSGIEME
ncbi:MAG: hypothetical protein WCK48_01310 [bacterium]